MSILTKVSDVLGRFLLGWYLIETARYFWTGRFRVEVSQLARTFEEPASLWTVLAPLQILVAGVGVFILIPLLWRGARSGLVAGVLYWGWGYVTNPLWFIIPSSDFVSPSGGPTALALLISIAWAVTTLTILVGFFFARRSIVRHQRRSEQNLIGVVT